MVKTPAQRATALARRRAAAKRKGQLFDPTRQLTGGNRARLIRRVQPPPASRDTKVPPSPGLRDAKPRTGRRNRGPTPGRDAWSGARPDIPPPVAGIRQGQAVSECCTFVVSRINGTQDDWGTALAIATNPRVLAQQASAPKLAALAGMYQKYKLKKMMVEATPLVGAACVAGTLLLVSDGASANTPTPPENVNACRERGGAVCAIGEHLRYTYTPPQRVYLTRPDGDASECSPGIVFVNTYLPTTALLTGAAFERGLWVVSVVAWYEFSVFEDPSKNVEDKLVDIPMDAPVELGLDVTGGVVVTGNQIGSLLGHLKPQLDDGFKTQVSSAKNAVLLVAGLIANAATVIPGPLGILVRAGCLIVKFVLVKVLSKELGAAPLLVPALRLYSSVDDALEERPVTAPGLVKTPLYLKGHVTSLTVGENPVNLGAVSDATNVLVPNSVPARSPRCYVSLNGWSQTDSVGKWEELTVTPTRGISIDHLGEVVIVQKGWKTALKTNAVIALMDSMGDLVYIGPLSDCPPNASADALRTVAWIVSEPTDDGSQDYYHIVLEDGVYCFLALDVTAPAPHGHWTGRSGVPFLLYPESGRLGSINHRLASLQLASITEVQEEESQSVLATDDEPNPPVLSNNF